MSEPITIGVVGLGIMGGSFATNILDAGLPVVGHDIVDAKRAILTNQGGVSALSAREVADQADVVITSMPTVASFHEVMTGENDYSNATMKMDVWQKDLEVIGNFAKILDSPLPLFYESTRIYNKGMEMGFDKLDTASVCQVLEQMAAIKR